MFGRRLLILVAILMGLTALAASVAPVPETARRNPRPPVAATPPPGVEPAGEAPAANVVARRIDAAPRGGAPVRITARTGEIVVLDVAGPTIDTVSIDGLAAVEPLDPQAPAHIELYADTPGDYPIRLLESGREIGVLEIAGRRRG